MKLNYELTMNRKYLSIQVLTCNRDRQLKYGVERAGSGVAAANPATCAALRRRDVGGVLAGAERVEELPRGQALLPRRR